MTQHCEIKCYQHFSGEDVCFSV